MGTAIDWQTQLKTALADKQVTIYNPRRDQWDATWVQSASEPMFNGQVNWEVDHIDEADIVFFFIDPATKSIVTFGEFYYILGQLKAGKHRDVIIVCPQGYWRRGNLEVMCNRFSLKLHETLEEGIEVLKGFIGLAR